MNRLAFLAESALLEIPVVGYRIGQTAAVSPAALGTFLHRVNGPQELTSFFRVSLEDLAPGVRLNPLEQPAKNFLRAVGPAVWVQARIAPTGGAVAAHIVDGPSRAFTVDSTGGRAQCRESRAQEHGDDTAAMLGTSSEGDRAFHGTQSLHEYATAKVLAIIRTGGQPVLAADRIFLSDRGSRRRRKLGNE